MIYIVAWFKKNFFQIKILCKGIENASFKYQLFDWFLDSRQYSFKNSGFLKIFDYFTIH
jgi:hypothetical protein